MLTETELMNAAAERVQEWLEGSFFVLHTRREVTEVVRDVSDYDETRVGQARAEMIQSSLIERGIVSYPLIAEADTGDELLFYRDSDATSVVVEHVRDWLTR